MIPFVVGGVHIFYVGLHDMFVFICSLFILSIRLSLSKRDGGDAPVETLFVKLAYLCGDDIMDGLPYVSR